MERWNGTVAVVTGASSGIGLATAQVLVQMGLIVIGLARRKAQMEDRMRDVKGPGQFFARQCDITNEESVIESFNWMKDMFGTVNILINNAGGATSSKKIADTSTADLEYVFKLNVMGLLYCTKQAINMMKENQKEAHIVNIGSTFGLAVPPAMLGNFNVYPASKFAVRALSETLRNELLDTKIRVTNISPGLTKTELYQRSVHEIPAFQYLPALEATDIADSIVYVLGTPSQVEINEITIQAKKV